MYPDEKTSDKRLEMIDVTLAPLIDQRDKLNKNIELLEEEKKLILQLQKVRELERRI